MVSNLIVSKVENGYIISVDGKLWIMQNLQEVDVFFHAHFEQTVITYKNVLNNELSTSDS